MVLKVHKEYVKPKPISRQNRKLTQQHNWKKGSSSPCVASVWVIIVIHYLLGFFILEKQLASQKLFLVRSELSITAYLFLVLYRSTPLQSLLFLKYIETFLWK